MRILIVDDNEAEAEALKRLLKRRFDADVFIAKSMHETRSVVAANNLDCIVLDLQLPDSGIEETIKEIGHLPYPTFVYTGFDDPGLRERVLNSGAEDFILKATGDAGIIERIGHLQYKRKPDPMLLRGAYGARHDETKRMVRSEWKGMVPRMAAGVVSVVMFASGTITGVWAFGKTVGKTTEEARQHFDRLDTAIVELKDAGRARDVALKELSEKATHSIDDRQAIKDKEQSHYDQITDWLKRIESKLDNARK